MDVWDDGFVEPEVKFPEAIIEGYIKSFYKVTNGYVSLNLLKLEGMSRKRIPSERQTFQFKLLLISDNVKGYSFEVLTFGYDVTIYPVHILLEEEIGIDIDADSTFSGERYLLLNDEQELIMSLEEVFKSTRFRKVVGGLIKIAKATEDRRK